MPFYASPGIYVEEVPSGARPIGAVGTSTAGFVGTAPDPSARAGEAVAVNSWSEFLRVFAAGERRREHPAGPRGLRLLRQRRRPLLRGQRRRRVSRSPAAAAAGPGSRLLEAVDEVAIVAAPGYPDPARLRGPAEPLRAAAATGWRSSTRRPDVTDIDRLTRVATAGSPRRAPRRPATTDRAAARRPAAHRRIASHRRPHGGANGLRPAPVRLRRLLLPVARGARPAHRRARSPPPSGHVAGIWARTDTLRGVHKAPANEPVRGALDLTYRVTRAEQDVLNPDGVNCIRYFPAEGIRVWGARTLAAEASEWRYLNVRRLFNMLKESIADGTRWIVFEPNDGTALAVDPPRHQRLPDPGVARRRAAGHARRRRRSSSSATRRPTRPTSATPARWSR